jgi:wyosine [tRNA(Phe)-imidazoG37] synthetase (radical SAM superfamily)
MSSQHQRVFGPVVSRRLGMSLGVDLVPMKTCSFNCIYCQLGKTQCTTVERRRFSDPEKLVAEVSEVLGSRRDIDYVTLSGSGEPTLELRIGEIVHRLKSVSDKPIAILTNGSMFTNADVREAVLEADLIAPSLDAATEAVFRKVNRPHESVTLDTLVAGLENLRREYTGAIWLEVMLLKCVNDDETHLRKLARLVERIRPDRVQLNTAVRPPADVNVEPLDQQEMETARRIFGPETEIIADVEPDLRHAEATRQHETAIISLASRRPVTAQEVSVAAGTHPAETAKLLAALERQGKLRREVHGGKTFYTAAGGSTTT